jgi:hypothetical protein
MDLLKCSIYYHEQEETINASEKIIYLLHNEDLKKTIKEVYLVLSKTLFQLLERYWESKKTPLAWSSANHPILYL